MGIGLLGLALFLGSLVLSQKMASDAPRMCIKTIVTANSMFWVGMMMMLYAATRALIAPFFD